jgi:YVTN family beta-propeller protein
VKLHARRLFATAAFASGFIGGIPTFAQNAYITSYSKWCGGPGCEEAGDLSIIDTATNAVTAKIPVDDGPSGVAVTRDRRKIYVVGGYKEGVVWVIDTATNAVAAKIVVDRLRVGRPAMTLGSAAVIPGGRQVYIASFNGVVVMATENNKLTTRISLDDGSGEMVMTPDGSKIYVADADGVAVIATANNKVIATIPLHGSDIAGMAMTPDGGKLYVAVSDTGTVSVIATATNTVIGPPIRVGRHAASVAVTPDGGKLYVADADTDRVSVIATATNMMIGPPIRIGSSPDSAAVTPDGRKVYVAVSDGVAAIATANNRVIAKIPTAAIGEGDISSIAIPAR